MEAFINHNGSITAQQNICISPDNRSFKYGDGCFETIKMINGRMPLEEFHFDRLCSALQTLQFTIPQNFIKQYLREQICNLANLNAHFRFARIRLTVYRGEAGTHSDVDNHPNFIIQSWKGNEESNSFNKEGLCIDFYRDAKKSCDIFSNLKSNNYLPYLMGNLWAKNKVLDDCLLFNCYNRIADATIANVFIVSNGMVKTPSLNEGCVSGVMRRYLLNCFERKKMLFTETQLKEYDVIDADEVFFTNAVFGIRWVKKLGNKNYENAVSSSLYQSFIAPLFS